MSIEWIKKLWYIYTTEYYSAIKRNTFESVLNEVDESRAYYTEWSKSEREREISYSNVYIQNLEKWYWRIYLQGSNRETGIENKIMDMGRGEESEMYGKSNMETYITICKIDSQWEFAEWLRKLKQGLCINLEGWDGEGDSRRRGHMYTYGWFMLDRK